MIFLASLVPTQSAQSHTLVIGGDGKPSVEINERLVYGVGPSLHLLRGRQIDFTGRETADRKPTQANGKLQVYGIKLNEPAMPSDNVFKQHESAPAPNTSDKPAQIATLPEPPKQAENILVETTERESTGTAETELVKTVDSDDEAMTETTTAIVEAITEPPAESEELALLMSPEPGASDVGGNDRFETAPEAAPQPESEVSDSEADVAEKPAIEIADQSEAEAEEPIPAPTSLLPSEDNNEDNLAELVPPPLPDINIGNAPLTSPSDDNKADTETVAGKIEPDPMDAGSASHEGELAKDPAKPETELADDEIAALPPIPKFSSPGDTLSILFETDSAALDSKAILIADDITKRLSNNPAMRLQIIAFATGEEGNPSRARRLSLSRALALRSNLIKSGIKSTRMDLRALGDNYREGPTDRVDAIILSP